MTEEQQEEVKPEWSFRFRHSRREGGFDIYLHRIEGRDGYSESLITRGQTLPKKLADARLFARKYAKRQGIPYKEYVKPPPPTEKELHWGKIRSLCLMLRHCDEKAKEYESGKRKGYQDAVIECEVNLRKAAEEWIHGARYCEELIPLWPGKSVHHANCATSRIERARECLDAWQTNLMNTKKTAWLKVITPMPAAEPPEEQ